jgi:hypothetical protein
MPATISKLQLYPTASISAVSLGRDGRVWFAILRNGPGPGVGSIDENGDIEMTQLDPVSYGHWIGGLAVDAKHGVWATMPCFSHGSCHDAGYARFGGDYRPLTTIRSLGTPDPMPLGIALMDDGSAWIAERNANAILHVSANDRQTVIRLSDREFYPVGAKVADDGGAFFDGPEAGKILAVDRFGHVHTYVLPTRSSHTSSARQGLDGIAWVAEYDANEIVAIDRKGRMTEYAVPTPNGGPSAISVDRRGVLWFIETDGEKLGRIDPDGTVEDAYLPIALGRPAYLEAAPDDMLVVVGYTRGLLGSSVSWAIARIPEATAMR